MGPRKTKGPEFLISLFADLFKQIRIFAVNNSFGLLKQLFQKLWKKLLKLFSKLLKPCIIGKKFPVRVFTQSQEGEARLVSLMNQIEIFNCLISTGLTQPVN